MLNRLSLAGVYSSMMFGARMARWYVPRAFSRRDADWADPAK